MRGTRFSTLRARFMAARKSSISWIFSIRTRFSCCSFSNLDCNSCLKIFLRLTFLSDSSSIGFINRFVSFYVMVQKFYINIVVVHKPSLDQSTGWIRKLSIAFHSSVHPFSVVRVSIHPMEVAMSMYRIVFKVA